MRVHVAGALPGERVTATVAHVSAHRAEAWATLQAIEAPSPERRPPACRAFGACGGCVLQHLDYPAQLAWKQQRVRRALAAHAALAGEVDACVASPQPLGYRNRSKLVCGGAPGRVVLGAYAPRTHQVVDLDGCRIAEPPLDQVAAALRDLLSAEGVVPYDERTLTGELRHVVLRVNHRGEVLAIWVSARPAGARGEALARRFRAASPAVVGVVENVNRSRGNVIYGDEERVLDGAGALDEQVGAVTLRLSPRAFFQANRGVAALAYAAIADAVSPRPTERVVDAYAGVGGIALTLAPRAGEVIGIEEHAAAVDDATASAARTGIGNARFVAGDAAACLAAVDRADLVVVNPPRKGCDAAVLAQIARLAPRTIAYLSCDPETLARDLAALAAHGYAARAVTPFDMLPHTPHVEALAALDRAGRAQAPSR